MKKKQYQTNYDVSSKVTIMKKQQQQTNGDTGRKGKNVKEQEQTNDDKSPIFNFKKIIGEVEFLGTHVLNVTP